jgi:hypothetical protein
MRLEDYARIGRRGKLLNPGRWDGNTDEEVGVVLVESGAYRADVYQEAKHEASDRIEKILNRPISTSFLGTWFQSGSEERQANIYESRASQSLYITEIQRNQLHSLQLEFEASKLPEVLAAAEFIRELQMQLQVDIIEDQRQAIRDNARLRQAATDAGMTMTDYSQMNLQWNLVGIEAARKEKLDRWEVHKERLANNENLRFLKAGHKFEMKAEADKREGRRQDSRTANTRS